jgi:hypothetical protein
MPGIVIFLHHSYITTFTIFTNNLTESFFPAFALALSGIVGTFYDTTPNQIRHGGDKWAIVYTALGCAATISGVLQVNATPSGLKLVF